MATWNDLADESRTAAIELFRQKRWRSFTSRAYFALYAAVSAQLIRGGLTLPADREGPHHVPLPTLIGMHLLALPGGPRWKVAEATRALYHYRRVGDYRPSRTIAHREARTALSLMNRAFGLLESNS
jgi:hypothetical protein